MTRHNEPMQATDYVVEWDDGVPGPWLKCRICDPKAGGQKGWLPVDDKWLGGTNPRILVESGTGASFAGTIRRRGHAMKTTVRVIRREANGTNLDDRTMDFEGPHGNIAHWFEELRTGQVIEIQTDIVGETYEPMQLDLGTLIARLEQIKEELDARDKEYREGHWLWDRVITCDLPRLQKYLTVAMRQDIEKAKRNDPL